MYGLLAGQAIRIGPLGPPVVGAGWRPTFLVDFFGEGVYLLTLNLGIDYDYTANTQTEGNSGQSGKGETMRAKKYRWMGAALFGSIVVVGFVCLSAEAPSESIKEILMRVGLRKELKRFVDESLERMDDANDIFAYCNGLEGSEGVYLGGPGPSELESVLREKIRGKLEEAGIKVLSEEEWNTAQGRPWLRVWVLSNKFGNQERYSCALRVECTEDAYLKRKGVLTTGLLWWQDAAFWDANDREVGEEVNEMIHAFINDYLAANPKESATEAEPNIEDSFLTP